MLKMIKGGQRIGVIGDMVRLNRAAPWPSRAKRRCERYAMIVDVEYMVDPVANNHGRMIHRYKLTTGETLNSYGGKGATLTLDSDKGKPYGGQADGAVLALLID